MSWQIVGFIGWRWLIGRITLALSWLNSWLAGWLNQWIASCLFGWLGDFGWNRSPGWASRNIATFAIV
ncbi:MAG TPA: hypothetical protein DEF47_24275 [Herpetosiphon sp.]|nr:hypothetical protein [Herpetosiphon sp.]